MNYKTETLKYVLFDLLSAGLAWTCFFAFRKVYLEPIKFGDVELIFDKNFYLGLVILPLFWVSLYWLAGAYIKIFRRSRLRELSQTLWLSIVGALVIFFTLLLDDQIDSYRRYYHLFFGLLGIHFGITFLFRFILTSIAVKKIHTGKIGFNTLLIGGNENAQNIYREIKELKQSPGNKFVGFVSINGRDRKSLEPELPYLAELRELPRILVEYNVEEVIIAIEPSEHESLGRIITELEGQDIIIKIIPDMYNILSGSVKMTSILGAALIEINAEIMPAWQQSFKRLFDIGLSLFALTILSPVYIIIGILVRASSPGPIIYGQERVGLHEKKFKILKFRSMFENAEENGPQLSSAADSRITPIGRFLRKSRLDELPQFFNVLIGDMSMVGPRPERQYYIDKIVESAPHYRHLLKVRPGITSWGQVKYGYAENVQQMVKRLKYDLLYIENMTLAVDFKILIYTVLTVLRGSGK